MPGQFSKSALPARPGAYFNFVARPSPRVLPNVGSIVALPFTHDWGPMDQPILCGDFNQWQAIFGPTDTTPGYKAVRMAFEGEGLYDGSRGGAGSVLAFRFGGAAAAKATKVLGNTTPAATALTLSARYEGTRGNSLRVTTRDAVTAGNDELVVYLGTVQVEVFEYLQTDIAALAADINARSDWLSAVSNITGVALTAVTSQALTGGNDGSTLVAGDWTAMMTALESTRFSVFAPFDLTDTSIVASLKTWQANLNIKGKRFMSVIGGAAAETVSVAITRATTMNDSNVVSLGIGTYTHDEFGDLSTSQLAPRVAGVIAAIGELGSLTFARFTGLTVKVGPSEADILDAFKAGLLVLTQDEDQTVPVRIERALTTFTTANDPDKPYIIYRSPRYVRIMHGIENELTLWAERNVIGRLPVSDKTREFVVGETRARMQSREERGIIQPGWTVEIDNDPAPTPEDEFIALRYGLTFGRSIEQVLNTVSIG